MVSGKRSNIERLFELTAGRSRRLGGVAAAALKAYELVEVEGMRVVSTVTDGVFRVDGADGDSLRAAG